jgi:hypothetical protein
MADHKPLCPGLMGLLVSLIILASVVQSLAQSQTQVQPDTPKNNEPQTIVCYVYMVVVRLHVQDQAGKEVSNLTRHDVIVYEDGVRQTIDFWMRDGDSETEGIQPGFELAYYPKPPFDGKFRRIRVVMTGKDKGRLRVEFSPKGYYARKELLR